MGHTVYYRTRIERWDDFKRFIEGICDGLGYEFVEMGESVLVVSGCLHVEPLQIKREGFGFAKTNLVEPCHSIYLLILHSLSSFGSVEVWEDR
ncbi:TonB-dependent receptor [Thermococcus sp. GR7]|nr:TonB-dependent receptor [Thermococcus sp. GR7]NJE78763.1 TonB-dependent receptor [Thermococcus sp. GR4]NJF22067.1 TonB-dependent receptor [Thermococcus sp. GR5]